MQLLVYNVDSLHTCTLHTWSFKNYVKACSVPLAQRSHWRGIWLSPSLVSVVCYRLQYMLRCTLRATLVTRGRVAFYMGPPVVPPYATFYISPFIVVQLTLNLTINPKPLTDPQVILFSLDAYLCTRACSRHMTLYGYKCQLVRVSGLGQRCSPCRASAGKWNSLSGRKHPPH